MDSLRCKKEEFINILESINPSKNACDVFSDWLIITAESLYIWKKDGIVEDEYLETIKRYSNKEREKFQVLFTLTQKALEEQERDFLGDIFISINQKNNRKVRPFPSHTVSEINAKMSIDIKNFSENKLHVFNVPNCGSGRSLIAGAVYLKKQGVNFKENTLFIGSDINGQCARMTYIQLTLLSLPAVVVYGNPNTKEIFWQRETFFFKMLNFKNMRKGEE